MNKKEVYCIFNNEIESRLTIGKKYEVLAFEFTTSKFKLINDKMETALYPSGWFTEDETEVVAALAQKHKIEAKYKLIKCNIDVQEHIVKFTLLDIDPDLVRIGNISEFVGYQTRNAFSLVSSSYGFTYISNLKMDIGSEIGRTGTFSTPNNKVAIQTAAHIIFEVDRINAKLSTMVKVKTPVFMIEHEPGGQKYAYKSDDKIEKGDLVVCHSSKGKYYGLCVEVTTDVRMQKLATKECFKVYNTERTVVPKMGCRVVGYMTPGFKF